MKKALCTFIFIFFFIHFPKLEAYKSDIKNRYNHQDVMPTQKIREKLNNKGFTDFSELASKDDFLETIATDFHGRRFKLLINRKTGDIDKAIEIQGNIR